MDTASDFDALLARAEACARRAPLDPETLDSRQLLAARDALLEAVATLDAILARLPEGQETVPPHALPSLAGRAHREADRGRFQRDPLLARRTELTARIHAIRRRLGALADPAFHARSVALAGTLVQVMRDEPAACLPSRRPVRFLATDDARHPYAADVEGSRWTVRVNEFPEEPSVYSLMVDGVVIEELMDWPAAWERPAD